MLWKMLAIPKHSDSISNVAEISDGNFLGHMKPINDGSVLYSTPNIIRIGNISHSNMLFVTVLKLNECNTVSVPNNTTDIAIK